MDFLHIILLPLFISFLIALISGPKIILLANKIGLVDDPKKHKHPALLHTKIIPRAGGLVFFLAIIPPALFFLPIEKKLIGIVMGATVVLIVGLLDDKYDLNPYLRLFSNFLAAAIAVGAGIGISSITNPFGGALRLDTIRIGFNLFGPHSIIILADIFALLWIAWVMNMVNWSKGVDGQMPGIVAIVAFVLGILALRFFPEDQTQVEFAKLAFLTTGASLGFLIFNFHPAKIFPGYSATVVGYVIAVLAILSQAKVGTAILILAVPSLDAVFTIGRRVVQGRMPVWADRGHFHHRLLSLGWTQRQVALFYWGVCAILGAISLYLKAIEKLFAIALVGVVLLGAILWINLQIKKEED